jgi:hypothetical protein
MRKPARRTKARKVASRLSCRTVHLRNPPFSHPKNRSALLRALRSAFRRQNARFPPRVRFPRRGFFGMPARIPRRRNPSRIAFASSAASASTPFGRVRASASPAGPRASSSRRRSCAFPGPTTTLKGSPSSFTQTRALVPFRLLCPSIPTPSPGVSQNRRTTARSCPTTRRGPTKLGHTPFPPFFASTRVESIATASTFTFPSVSPQSRRAGRILPQTPFSWSSGNRRQAVGSAPYGRGISHHRQPATRTSRIPWRTLRSSTRGLPVLALSGRKGAMKAHGSSVRS